MMLPPQFLQLLQQVMAQQGGQSPQNSGLPMRLGAGPMQRTFPVVNQPQNPFAQMGQQMAGPYQVAGANAGGLQWLQQILGGMGGTNSGGVGTRGPAPNPFIGLRRFAGPFGNGGGAISPRFGGQGRPF